MRIRKHAKLSLLLHHTTPSPNPCALLHTTVCLLNQSPWDTMDFSPPSTPPPHQGGGDGVSDDYVSSGRRVSAPNWDEDHQPEYYTSPPPENETKAAPAAQCCKTDGKRWKCRREAATGGYLCDHHLSQAKKSYTTSSKKPTGPRAQPKKVNKTSSNPYEFYYYSGFGPSWSKKRGENSNHNNNILNYEIKRAEAYENDSEFEEYDEEEWNRADLGKKRARKPIKARSLKSIM